MPRCKECKDKFEAKYFNQKFCLLKDECISAHVDYAKAQKKKQEDKEWKQRKAQQKPIVYAKRYKNNLQNEINKLSRAIDTCFRYDCIDCNRSYGKQADGAHYSNVGGHENIRYNLHNIHKSRSDCNQFSSEHKSGYKKGLIERYGDDYFNFIAFELNKQYPSINLTEHEIVEKLAIVRKLNRDFDTFKLSSAIEARNMFNKLIGIYTI